MIGLRTADRGPATAKSARPPVGIVMARYRLTAQQGCDLLVKESQNSDRKLGDSAADVTATGTLPMRRILVDDLLTRVATGASR